MSDAVKFAPLFVALAGLVWVTGFVLERVREKQSKKMHDRDFLMMCDAVAVAIASKTDRYYYDQIRKEIQYNITEGVRYDADLVRYIEADDYLRFAFLSAKRSAADYQTELKDFCEHVSWIDVGKDLKQEKKTNPYLVSFCVWMMVFAVVISVLTEYVL